MFVFGRSSQCTGMAVIHVVNNMEMIQSGVTSVLKGRKKMLFIQFLSGMIHCLIMMTGASAIVMVKKIPLGDLRIMGKITIDAFFSVIIERIFRFILAYICGNSQMIH